MRFEVAPYVQSGTTFHFLEYVKQFSDVKVEDKTISVEKENVQFLKYIASKYQVILKPI